MTFIKLAVIQIPKYGFLTVSRKKGGNELTDDVTQRSVGQYGEIYAEYGTVRLFPVVDNYSLIIV